MNAYIGVDGNVYRELIEVTSIVITRAEGPIHMCGRPRTVESWIKANSLLRDHSRTAPDTIGYDKCDYVVTFADGSTYSGRYDLVHYSRQSPDLAASCRGTLEYIISTPDGPWDASHVERAREMLQTHHLQQGAVPVPDGADYTITRDYRQKDESCSR